jgi:hypothetical protein
MRFRDRIDHVSAGGVGFEEQAFFGIAPAGRGATVIWT